MFRGSMVALVTPFDEHGSVDQRALERLVAWHLDQGTHGIVPCGTTGESATLTHAEHRRVVEIVVAGVGGRIPVLAGTGSNSTDEAIELTRHAKAAGADGVLLISPYYNKPSQEGLYRHFKAISEAVDIPQVLYNVPGRTVVELAPATVARLATLANVVALKEATGSIRVAGDMARAAGDCLPILSGDDFSNLGLLAMGAVGAISVTANVVPREMAALCDAWDAGDVDRARRIHHDLIPLHTAMFMETNPIPVKAALAMMGRIGTGLRMPLCELDDGLQQSLHDLLAQRGLLRVEAA